MIYFWFALIPCKLQNPLRSWEIRIAFMNYFLYGELLASNTSPNLTRFLPMPLSLPKDVTKFIIFRQAQILHIAESNAVLQYPLTLIFSHRLSMGTRLVLVMAPYKTKQRRARAPKLAAVLLIYRQNL